MKIIGTTEVGYIVEMHRTEVANVAGYRDHSSMVHAMYSHPRPEKLYVGTLIDFSAHWQHYLAMREAHARLAKVATELGALSTLAGTLVDGITIPKPEEATNA